MFFSQLLLALILKNITQEPFLYNAKKVYNVCRNKPFWILTRRFRSRDYRQSMGINIK